MNNVENKNCRVNEDCHCDCQCCGCESYTLEKPSKKKYLLVALLAGGLVGAVFGLKYKSELIKAANSNMKSLKKNKYVKQLNSKDLDKLAKEFRKKANKASKQLKNKSFK